MQKTLPAHAMPQVSNERLLQLRRGAGVGYLYHPVAEKRNQVMHKEGLTTQDYERIDAILNKFYPGPPPKPKKQKTDKSQLDLFEEDKE